MKTGEQGGFCIAAHPMAKGVNSLSFQKILEVIEEPDAAKILLGVEAFNGGLVYTRRNQTVLENARALPLAQVGNSDAHILRMIGNGSSYFNGHTVQDLRKAIQSRTTIARHDTGLTGSMVATSYIPNYLLRKLGWVTWNENPGSSIRLAHLSEVLATS